MAKIILMDWQRGKIPFFVAPPEREKTQTEDKEIDENEKTDKNVKVKNF
jgi:hypothetical protein